MKKPTITEIARKTGVSTATVSRALNNQPKVAPELRQQIIAAALQMGYQAQGNSRSRIVAILLTNKNLGLIGHYLRAVIQRLVTHESVARNYRIMIVYADDLSILDERSIAGVISLNFLNHLSRTLPTLKNLPLVCINDYNAPSEGIYSVCSNERQGIRLALDHLLKQGHRRIGLLQSIEGGENLCSQLRERSFRERLEEAGCPSNLVKNNDPLTTSFEAVGLLLQQNITALMVPGESIAYQIMHILGLYGKKIPQDLSLITWESPEVSEFMVPRATTVAQNFAEIAATAFDMLESQIAGQPVVADVLIDYELHLRESTAPPHY